MTRKKGPIAFVTPWFGENITGGAEMEARELAHHLADAGMEVEILTTCVQAFTADWNINYYNAGCFRESGLTVRRFPVRTRDTEAFDAVNRMIEDIRVTSNGVSAISGNADACVGAKDEVVDVIASLSGISEENAASSQETGASMQELSATVATLSESARSLKDVSSTLLEEMSFFKG